MAKPNTTRMSTALAPHHYMVVLKTDNTKYHFVQGTDIADACNKAGIGGGEVSAIDNYADITAFVRSKAMQKTLREVANYGEHGYYWKRETCAKIVKLNWMNVLLYHEDAHKCKGWKIGSAGIALLNHFCKEN